jgi:3-oxoacyl-[acyl-carrier protein] reductase
MGIELRGRVALVTGATNGIGRATALTFARAGAAIAAWDRAEPAGRALVDEIAQAGGLAAFFGVDVASQPAVEAAVAATLERFGRIDILINNAGITRDAQLVKVKNGAVVGAMSADDFEAVLNVNLKGVFACTQAVVPAMIRQGYGRIVNAASVVALYGNFGQTNYVASKAGVVGMTKVWAHAGWPRRQPTGCCERLPVPSFRRGRLCQWRGAECRRRAGAGNLRTRAVGRSQEPGCIGTPLARAMQDQLLCPLL